jgi:hypothetical protein
LHDFQASSAVKHYGPVAEIGAKMAGLELTEAHLPGHRAIAGELAPL